MDERGDEAGTKAKAAREYAADREIEPEGGVEVTRARLGALNHRVGDALLDKELKEGGEDGREREQAEVGRRQEPGKETVSHEGHAVIGDLLDARPADAPGGFLTNIAGGGRGALVSRSSG